MPLPDEILGRYRVIGRIATGALGTVVAAVDQRSGREVAIKLFDGADDNHATWVDELRLAARLDHPHIAACLDAGEDQASGRQVLVFARALGGSLRRALVSGCAFDDDAVTSLLAELAGALAHAHARRVIHRDVKPENILCLETSGRPPWALTDFGAGRFLARGATARSLAGSLLYMAPEVLLRAANAASDQYSLGIVGLELLAGDLPTGALRARFLREHRGAEGVRGAIARLVDPDPSRRFVDVAALARALAGRPITIPPQTHLCDGARLILEGDQVLMSDDEGEREGATRGLGRLGRARGFVSLDGERLPLIAAERRLVAADAGGLSTVYTDERRIEVLAASRDHRAVWLRDRGALALAELPFGAPRLRAPIPPLIIDALARAPRTLGAVLSPSAAVFTWPDASRAMVARVVGDAIVTDVYSLPAPLYTIARLGPQVVAIVGDHERARLLILDAEGPCEVARADLSVDSVKASAGPRGPTLSPLVPSLPALAVLEDTQQPTEQGTTP